MAGVSVHSLWGTPVPQHGEVAQGQASGGHQGGFRGLCRGGGTLLGAVTLLQAHTSLWKTWLVPVSTSAKAGCLTDLRKGVRRRKHMNESFTGVGLFIRLN